MSKILHRTEHVVFFCFCFFLTNENLEEFVPCTGLYFSTEYIYLKKSRKYKICQFD